jgi:hypothetical protein
MNGRAVIARGLCLMASLLVMQAGLASAPVATVYFFVQPDCPISNFYAPEIKRICGDQPVVCELVYVDPALTAQAVEEHAVRYGLGHLRRTADRERDLIRELAPKVTPEVVVVDKNRAVRYRGRIDDRYPSIGKKRQVVTTHDLRDALVALVAGRRVAVTETKAVGCSIADLMRIQPEE